jgi:hypothetical protein
MIPLEGVGVGEPEGGNINEIRALGERGFEKNYN